MSYWNHGKNTPRTEGTDSDNPHVGMASMIEHVRANADFCRVMLGPNGKPAFVERVVQYSEMRLRNILPGSEFQLKPNSSPLDLCVRYLSHAGVGAMARWPQVSLTFSSEQVAAWNNHLYIGVLREVADDNT